MKRRITVSAVFAMLLFLVTPLYATNGMRLIGFGPVQRAMGGTSVAVQLDAASVITNPAGMVDLGGRIDFGASYFSPKVTYKPTVLNFSSFGYPIGTTSDKKASPIPAFGLILPINEDLAFGIGAYGVSGLGVDYKRNFFNGVLNTAYSQLRFAPGLAYKIHDMLSIGAVINVMYATMEYEAGANYDGLNPLPTQYAHLNGSSFGIGATFGLNFTPVKQINIGVSYELRSYFQEFTFNTFVGKEKIRFDQPMNATVGLGIKPIDALTIALEFQWIDWTATNGVNKPKYSQRAITTIGWNLSWKDQFIYKIGINYDVNKYLSVRAGFNYGKMPVNKTRAFENAAFPAVAEFHYTAGLTLNLNEKFGINLGAMYSPISEVSGSGLYAANVGFTPPFTITYVPQVVKTKSTMSQYSLELGLVYRFSMPNQNEG